MPNHASRKEAENAAAGAGISALELRWMADNARHDHPRSVGSFRGRPSQRLTGCGSRDSLHFLLAPGTALGGSQLSRNGRLNESRKYKCCKNYVTRSGDASFRRML